MFKMLKTPGMIALIAIPVLLSGCGLWGETTSDEIDPEKEVNFKKEDTLNLDEKEDQSNEKKPAKEKEKNVGSVPTELYLFDKNGFVVPQTVMLPKTQSVAEQSITYLIKGGPVQNVLPNGFQAVLPADTQVKGVNLKEDGTLTINFSKEFSNYKAQNEKEILEAITWTATQFDSVDNVKIWVEGVNQEVMPVNGTPIGNNGFSRMNGINQEASQVVDVTRTSGITLFFPSKVGERSYYVPVTKRVHAESDEVAAAVKTLLEGPFVQSGLMAEFGGEVELLDDPVIKNGVVTLNFNEAIFSNIEKNIISNEALRSLVLSLTSQQGIEKVAIQVNGEAVMNESGEKMAEPVSRPKQVNALGL